MLHPCNMVVFSIWVLTLACRKGTDHYNLLSSFVNHDSVEVQNSTKFTDVNSYFDCIGADWSIITSTCCGKDIRVATKPGLWTGLDSGLDSKL